MIRPGSELSNIQDLLNTFPEKTNYSPDKALKIITTRYSQFNRFYPDIIEHLKKHQDDFSAIFLSLPVTIHKFLCKDIFSNAGEFRKKSDPGKGMVYFGPSKHRGLRIEKYKGCVPEKIEAFLKSISNSLRPTDTNPVLSICIYYQKFVYMHPFYDLNGRIARLIASIYLGFHGKHIYWSAIENDPILKRRFITLLNNCHNQMGKPNYPYKVDTLYRFWNKYTKPYKDFYIE